jgi:hypothetical protein
MKKTDYILLKETAMRINLFPETGSEETGIFLKIE